MTSDTDRQTRRVVGTVFVSFWILVIILGVVSNVVKLHSPIPIENYWERWCHNWTGLATDFLFGSGFLIVGLSFILFSKKMFRVLMQKEADDISQSWGLIIGGLFIILPGIAIRSNLIMDWVTYCYP